MARFRKSDDFSEEGFSLSKLISTPIRKIGEILSGGEDGLSRSPGQNFRHAVGTILFFPFTMLLMFFGFLITAWASSRSGKAFLLGLPALLTASVLFIGVGVANHFYRNIVFNRYEGAATRKLNAELPNQAALLLRRLVHEQPNEPRLKFSLAIALDATGDEKESLRIMQSLVPDDKPGFVRAHIWIANEYMVGDSSVPIEQRLANALNHLERAKKIEADNLQVRMRLAITYEQMGNIEEAIDNYLAVVNFEFPADASISDEYSVYLAQAGPPLIGLLYDKFESTGSASYRDEAIRYKDKIVFQLQRITDRSPNNLNAWRIIVTSQIGVKQYDAASRTIEEARRLARSNETRMQLQSMMAQLMLEYSEELKSNPDKFQQRFKCIARAVDYDSRNGQAIEKLIEIGINPETVSNEIKQLLSVSQSSEGISPLIMDITLASRAAIAGNSKEAIAHLKVASIRDKKAPAIVNSICMKLFYKPIDRPEYALRLITAAGDVWADIPNLNFTRGEILMELNRPEDALAEYKHALGKLEKHVPLRRALVKCLEQLGQTDEAEMHRKELQRLESTLSFVENQTPANK